MWRRVLVVAQAHTGLFYRYPKNGGSVALEVWQLRCPREIKVMLYVPEYTDPRSKHFIITAVITFDFTCAVGVTT
jgi:hypothetical protein